MGTLNTGQKGIKIKNKNNNIRGVNCNFNLADEKLSENLAPNRNDKRGCTEGNNGRERLGEEPILLSSLAQRRRRGRILRRVWLVYFNATSTFSKT